MLKHSVHMCKMILILEIKVMNASLMVIVQIHFFYHPKWPVKQIEDETNKKKYKQKFFKVRLNKLRIYRTILAGIYKFVISGVDCRTKVEVRWNKVASSRMMQ